MTDPKTFRCHDADACALGQLPCPTPAACGCSAPCPVKDGTHQPAEALQQITEPALQSLRDRLRFTHMRLGHAEHFVEVRASVVAEVIKLADRQHARIAELEKNESNLIAQRDHCEEVIDRMADAVLGKDRPEWSSAYDFMDAAQEVDDRIAELESQLEAIGAGGVEPLRKQAAQAVHQIAEPAAPVGKPIKDAIDALVMAAFTEGGCSEHRMSEARIQTELRKKELCTLLSTPQACCRSHPHEEMTPMCELRTEIARLTNALARAEAAAPQAVQAAVPVAGQSRFKGEKDWHWCSPEHVAMVVATPSEWQGYEARYLYAHPTTAHPAEGVPAQAEPFMWAIQEPGGSAYMDENCVSTSRGIVEAEVDGLNLGLGADDEPYKVVPVYLAATQPAAQGMDAQQYRLVERGELIEAGDQFLRDDFTWQIDPQGIFVGMPHGAGLRPARRALAAQAKHGGA